MTQNIEMNTQHGGKTQLSYVSCPPKEFAGRHSEREQLKKILEAAKGQGQVVMLSGASGSGKTSFLDWAEDEIQNNPDGLNSPAIRRSFPETSGLQFITYKELLTELKGHKKFGWFEKILAIKNVRKSIEIALGVLEKFSPSGVAAARGLLPGETVELSQLFLSFRDALKNLSSELTKNNRFVAILCDETQWLSEPYFGLFKDLIRNLPPCIAFVVAFRHEDKYEETYKELRQLLDKPHYTEIPLSGMPWKEIKELAKKRYKLSIDDATAQFLNENIGDPLCLVGCFELLQERGLHPTLTNVQKVKGEATNPARCIHDRLDVLWQKRTDCLSILYPPLPLSLIARMIDPEGQDESSLRYELDKSMAFTKLDKGLYDFVHPSLREYCREQLTEDERVKFHSKAADCIEALRDKLPEGLVDLSLAEHLFIGQRYKDALDLNLELGDWQYDHFNYISALQLTERAQTCAEKTKDTDNIAEALHQKGIILQFLFRFPDALDAHKESLEIWQEIGDRAGEAKTLRQIGRVYRKTGHFEDALNAFNQSLKIKKEIGNRAGEARTLHQIGSVYRKIGRFNDALNKYKESLEIKREIGDRALEATTLHHIGRVYQETNRFDDALEYYNQSLKIEQELGDRAGKAKTLHQIGMVYELTNRFEDALEYYNQSLEIEQELGNRAGEAQTLHQIGMVYQETSSEETNRSEDALEYYKQSLVITREIGTRALEAKTLHAIGFAYQLANRFEDALEYYNQSLKVKQEIGNRAGEAITLRQIGIVHQCEKRFEDALKYYNQSLKIDQDLGNRVGEAETLLGIGMVYEDTNRFEDALEFYNNGLVVTREIGDRDTEAMTLHQIGRIYEETNHFEDALDCYNQSLKIEQDLGASAGEAISLETIKALKGKMQGGER